jgi:DNA-directed RNA polymerase specialized sigma subunit
MLLERSPELFDKVTQKDIARYLGITPVALSRISTRGP